ncbi:putative Globin domain fused with STAS (Sulphate Transporter and Anti-Sigma factor antagonist) domain protein [Vibrio nigripulchritudo SFn27]|uniref:Putative Globin domain fused with STAS (Sulphate Transporter and Anti-Sigma factor antagonist) domain protein n=1 Tax=Vibrio nigripulchritudo TaxID=28173 RepID=U4KBG3_9VIBR|nr:MULTISPECIES: protoglobin domain-containing protein [Vibrio]UAB71987.1 STAS domain-containing protein [Vibrio sp. SCSIO 43132]CCN37061.1 putative Globin domain fused with STAS (Sulphate Transporter and Anti-Sigma factor antagonist) domain protein [Vibrio nigripulchritudo AM115]CCN42119.1 putative Globin domain fused with STAS (Sulphate Transporter and Anti-Sigma factor antagonist) domain protein [Vibrio nigripulchritudo FTn2]CCN62664.1 putative Globin domain fused with STAS (Sulphate Transpo
MSSSQGVQADPKALMELHDLTETDLALIRKFGKIMTPKMDEYVRHFYTWLETLPEYKQFFNDSSRLNRVQNQQLRYWESFFEADINNKYIAERIALGEVHARVGLSLPTYFAGMNMSLVIFTKRMYDGSLYSDEYSALVTAFTKLLHMDTTIVVETYSNLINRRISEQSEALLAMSTPVTMIWQDILMLPIVGIIDSKRAQDIMSAVLGKIADARAKIFIMDISGVAVVDTAVANHFIKITKATRLMGCECLVSGVSPAIAQTMVQLGINVGEVRTNATLRDALEEAFNIVGLDVQDKAS